MVALKILKDFYSESCRIVEKMAEYAEVEDLDLYYEPVAGNVKHFGILFGDDFKKTLIQNDTRYFMCTMFIAFVKEAYRTMINNPGQDGRGKMYRKILCDFDPKSIIDTYGEADALLAMFQEKQAEISTDDAKSVYYWNNLAMGLIDSAKFLLNTDNVKLVTDKTGRYYKFAEDLWNLLQKDKNYRDGITGINETLAWYFIKETGYFDIGSPDRYIEEIVTALGYNVRRIEKGINGFDTQEALWDIAKSNDVTVYKIDKMIHLICTGMFYLDNRIPSQKATYLRAIRKIRA